MVLDKVPTLPTAPHNTTAKKTFLSVQPAHTHTLQSLFEVARFECRPLQLLALRALGLSPQAKLVGGLVRRACSKVGEVFRKVL